MKLESYSKLGLSYYFCNISAWINLNNSRPRCRPINLKQSYFQAATTSHYYHSTAHLTDLVFSSLSSSTLLWWEMNSSSSSSSFSFFNRNTNVSMAVCISLPIITGATAAYFYYYYHQHHNHHRSSEKKSTSSNSPRSASSPIDKSSSLDELIGNSHRLISVGIEEPLVIAMVGLPARGKSYIVKMTIRYLKWIGFEAKEFNVGSYRRHIGKAGADANFFDGGNPDGQKVREEMAMAVQDMMYDWLREVSDMKRRIAVFDATNTTISRRLKLANRAKKENVSLLFVESICDDQSVLVRNYDLKLRNDDYKNTDPEEARADFLRRVAEYEKVYETIEDFEDSSNISYIKLINVGQKIIARNCQGYLPSQVAFYLQNIHIFPRKIYLTVNPERLVVRSPSAGFSLNALSMSEGEGGKGLSSQGRSFSSSLYDYILHEQQSSLVDKGKEVIVLTGTSDVHYESVRVLAERGISAFYSPLLNELQRSEERTSDDKQSHHHHRLNVESYLDVIERIRPVIIELERQKRSIVIVCHIAIIRCIYAYFMGVSEGDVSQRDFLSHHIYELSPGPFGCTCALINPLEQSTDHAMTPKSVSG